jgi:hypothetical protein
MPTTRSLTAAIDSTLQVTGASPTRVLGVKRVSGTFTDASLTAGKLTVAHSLGRKPLPVTVSDSGDNLCVMPVRFVDANGDASVNHVTLDFSEWGTLVGTYSYEIG